MQPEVQEEGAVAPPPSAPMRESASGIQVLLKMAGQSSRQLASIKSIGRAMHIHSPPRPTTEPKRQPGPALFAPPTPSVRPMR